MTAQKASRRPSDLAQHLKTNYVYAAIPMFLLKSQNMQSKQLIN
jgi:hypothetical protein